MCYDDFNLSFKFHYWFVIFDGKLIKSQENGPVYQSFGLIVPQSNINKQPSLYIQYFSQFIMPGMFKVGFLLDKIE